MIFDEKTHTSRFFAKKLKTNNIIIYPYYEIKIIKIDKITNTQTKTLALIIQNNNEYYLQFLEEDAKKYKNEIINKFIKLE